MIPEDFIQQLLARVDIVEVIDRHVPLKKAGANYQACCPFHKEKTPSFTVSPTKQFYHCFGCGAHGTAIGFLMEYKGLGFRDAVHELAQSVGLKVPDDGERSASQQASPLLEVMQQAAMYYQQCLRTSDAAKAYLRQRGLTGEIARRFQLGYAPPGWQALAEVFPDYPHDPRLELAGLVSAGDAGRRYDRFRDRIIFPILSQQGAVIGLGGRILGAQSEATGPKYLNSPETPLFSKGRELYGLFQAQQAIRQANRVLVVEGYMDVVALAQHGIDYAVATLGTATTELHAQRLLRLADDIVFAFDGDAAGQRAAWRALENVLPTLRDGKQIRFLFLPVEHDPDSYVRERGREAFESLVAAAIPLSSYWIAELRARHPGDTAEARAARAAAGRAHLERVTAMMMRESLAAELARDVELAASRLLPTSAPSTATGPAWQAPTPSPQSAATSTGRQRRRPWPPRIDPVQQQLRAAARRILARPHLAMHLVDLPVEGQQSPHLLRLLKTLVDHSLASGMTPHAGGLLERLRDSEFERDIRQLLLDPDGAIDETLSDEEVEEQLRSLRQQIESGQLLPKQPEPIVTPPGIASGGIIGALPARRSVLTGDRVSSSETSRPSPSEKPSRTQAETDEPPF